MITAIILLSAALVLTLCQLAGEVIRRRTAEDGLTSLNDAYSSLIREQHGDRMRVQDLLQKYQDREVAVRQLVDERNTLMKKVAEKNLFARGPNCGGALTALVLFVCVLGCAFFAVFNAVAHEWIGMVCSVFLGMLATVLLWIACAPVQTTDEKEVQ